MHKDQILRSPRTARVAALLVLALGVLPLLGAAPATAQRPIRVVDIDCGAGDLINPALLRWAERELVINVKGICTEDVVIRRDRVTLRGTDPAVDGIRSAATGDPYGAALFVRGGRVIQVENLLLTGGKRGLAVEDVRRNIVLRNLRIQGNEEVGLQASASLVVGFNLEITGNGLAGVGVSETGYFRCDDCRIADNPAPGAGFGILASAGALATLSRGTISGRFPLSVRLNSMADLNGTGVSGLVALDASERSTIKLRNATVDGSVRASSDSRIQLRNAQQVFNPAPGGNTVSGASRISVSGGTTLIGETALDEHSTAVLDQGCALESLVCFTGSDAICGPGVAQSSSGCPSCP